MASRLPTPPATPVKRKALAPPESTTAKKKTRRWYKSFKRPAGLNAPVQPLFEANKNTRSLGAFGRLPLEVREKIWHYLAQSVTYNGSLTFRYTRPGFIVRNSMFRHARSAETSERFPRNIMYSSWLFKEIERVVWRNSRLEFDDAADIRQCINSLDEHQKADIRTVSLYVGHEGQLPLWCAGALTGLGDLKALRRVRVSVRSAGHKEKESMIREMMKVRQSLELWWDHDAHEQNEEFGVGRFDEDWWFRSHT